MRVAPMSIRLTLRRSKWACSFMCSCRSTCPALSCVCVPWSSSNASVRESMVYNGSAVLHADMKNESQSSPCCWKEKNPTSLLAVPCELSVRQCWWKEMAISWGTGALSNHVISCDIDFGWHINATWARNTHCNDVRLKSTSHDITWSNSVPVHHEYLGCNTFFGYGSIKFLEKDFILHSHDWKSLNFWPASVSQITMRGLDRYKSTRTLLPRRFECTTSSSVGR